jgi:ribosomal protein S18 acetylase RimI-like enzyme
MLASAYQLGRACAALIAGPGPVTAAVERCGVLQLITGFYHGLIVLPPVSEHVPAQSTVPVQSTVAASRPEAAEAVALRRATGDDADALALVGAATFLEAFTWMLPGADIVAHCRTHHTPEAYRTYFAAPHTRIVLAEVVPGGAPVGYAMLTAPELPTFAVRPDDIELKRIYLLSRFRSRATPVTSVPAEGGRSQPAPGLRAGQALMDAGVAEAVRMGRTRLLLGTHAGNLQAIAFYRRNGFVEAGTRTFQVGAQVCSDLIFARPL